MQQTEQKLRAATIQIKAYLDKAKTIKFAKLFIEQAANCGCHLVCLPEAFPGPYGNEYFEKYSEVLLTENSASEMMSTTAKKLKIYIVGGVIEKENQQLYNTVLVYNPKGELVTKYRKIHLSAISISKNCTTSEADMLVSGNEPVTFDIKIGEHNYKIGISICFDLRFQRLSQYYSYALNCDMILYPSAFLYTTGELHWELLLRSRALDNQVYTLGSNHSRESIASIEMFGNSMIVDPWGKVMAKLPSASETGGAFVYADIDKNVIIDARNRIPLRKLGKKQLYFNLFQKAKL